MILCSDGFYRALTEQEVVTGLRVNPQTACDTLVGQALVKHRKQQDNLTVIALKRYTRAPISRRLKLALAAALIVIIASGPIGYGIGKFLAAGTMSIEVKSAPTADKQKAMLDASRQAKNIETPPKPKSPQKTNSGPSKKNDTEKNGSKPTAPPTQPQTSDGTTQFGQEKPRQPPAGTQDSGNTQDKSGSSQTDSQDQQNKPGPTQTQGTAPVAPTTPVQPNDKKNSAAPPAKDDQPKSPAPPKDNQANPPQSPNANFYERHTQIEG